MRAERVHWGRVFVGTLLAALLAVAPALASAVRVGPEIFSTPGENPVNIGVGQPTFRFAFLPGDVDIANNAWSIFEIGKYLNEHLTEEVKEKLVQQIPSGGLDMRWHSWSSVGLGFAGFSTDASIRTLGDGRLAKDLADLVLNGNDPNRHYTVDGTEVGAAAFGDVSVGFAFNIGPSFRVGGRYHRLMGIGYLEAEAEGSGILHYTDEKTGFEGEMALDARYIWGSGLHGDGTAFDLGVAWHPNENLALSFAVMDLGHITWHDVYSERYEGKLDADGGPALELVEKEVISGLKWTLPRRFEVSLGYRVSPTLHLGGSYTRTVHGTGEGFTYREPDRIEAALHWSGLAFLSVGVGVSYVPGEAVSLTGEAGLRLGPVRTRLRLEKIEAVFGGQDDKAVGFTFDLGIVF